MGAVYEAVQVSLGRPVAVKVLKADATGKLTAEELERFGREARSAAALGHPNIVQVTDFQPQSSPPFLVMERLSGESLREAIAREKCLPVARVAFVGTQILDALAAAHDAGIVHRDVKPDNVFLTRMAAVSDLVKVVDFGIAKVSSGRAITAFGAMMGSPAYMSPEQAAGRPVDPRSDVWGAGATLYHAASGKLPFPATSLAELLVWIAERPPVPLGEVVPGVDPRLTAVLTRAMERDPARRFQSAREMQAALAPLLPSANAHVVAPSTGNVSAHPSTVERSVAPLAASVRDAHGVTTGSPPHVPNAPSYVQSSHASAGFARAPSPSLPGPAPHGPPAPAMPNAPIQPHGVPPIARSTPTWPWLFAVFGGVSLVLLGALFALALHLGSKTDGAPEGDPASDWSDVRGTPSSKCAPRRWAVHGTGKLDFHPLDADDAKGLSSQLGPGVDVCGKDCPGPTSYMVRIYNDGRVGEVSEPVELCPSRDECVRKALLSRHVGAPPDAADAVVELSCTFP